MPSMLAVNKTPILLWNGIENRGGDRSAFSKSNMPVPPRAVLQPKNILEALEQRMAKYKEAYTQATATGDERKARMHERIAKQYQSAIRAHKAKKTVNLQELPVPPGFPPFPGQENERSPQDFSGVLEAANKLALEKGDDDEKKKELHPSVKQKPCKPMLAVCPMTHDSASSAKQSCTTNPFQSNTKHSWGEGLSSEAHQQDGHRKLSMKVGVQTKQKDDLEQDKQCIHTVSGSTTDVKMEALSLVPSPPTDEEDDFVVINHIDVQISQRDDQVYSQLSMLLKEQYEKCATYSMQFSHLGNITETIKFETMAENYKKNIESLEQLQAQGRDPPKHCFEERTYRITRIFTELSSTEMVVTIVKGMNLPAPQGLSAQQLNAFVRFQFPYPISDQPQSHKTTAIGKTSSPEYNQSFTLTINRNHRGLQRVIQKGLKLEVVHKGGFLRRDKPMGCALLKLDKLERESEMREIIEVTEGRKTTGGRLEVRVRLREPLSGQDLQITTERWLVLEQPMTLAQAEVPRLRASFGGPCQHVGATDRSPVRYSAKTETAPPPLLSHSGIMGRDAAAAWKPMMMGVYWLPRPGK
ncbi:coiled-coil and C2 domain-containing protein 1B-like [Conger conger]|uniref:coiled-coil and C2 domain-containing protein 1B-like n=1 Tax=Conger conger TaxID=82655 RepID=UPI002A5A88CF|nr:coiled-coil and C2 domain-containing protein 1B-like [Conger conger]